jgi:glycosyltransferase 2 family protein
MALFTPWRPRTTRTVGFLLAGVALFLVLIWLVGAASVGHLLLTVGWSVVLLPFPHILVAVFETLGWWFAFSRQGCPLPFATLFRFAFAVKAVQGVTPSLSQAGEVAKLHLLLQAGVGPDLATASLVTAKTTVVTAELTFIILGFAASLGYVSIDPALKMGTVVGVVVLAVALAGVLIWQWLGVFRPVVRLGRRLPVLRRFFERHEALLLSTDAILKEYLVEHRRRFWASALAYFVFWLAGSLETWFTMWMIGLPVSVFVMLFIHVWLAVVTRLTAFVPANLGTAEAGALMVFALVGLPAEGALAFSLLRRFRQLVWIAVGLAVWPGARPTSAPAATIETSGSVRS